MQGFDRYAVLGSCAIVCMVAASPAAAQMKSFDVPAQLVQSAIAQLGRQADIQIIAARKVTEGKRTAGVRGDMTVERALSILLDGTGLIARQTGQQTYTIVRASPDTAEPEQGRSSLEREVETAEEIVVTGSQIRGAEIASPVISRSLDEMRDQGQLTLSDVVRTIPQSFGGGQNPGIGITVPTTSGVDVGGGASFNLRGLGSDATLTLLNGHRLPYNSSRQSVDVSTIPLGALQRIEIVPDGASAIYGSDAVGGVVNIILKRDQSGIETRAGISAATEGGYVRKQAAVTGGARWDGGGFLLAYEFNHSTAVDGEDRDFAAPIAAGVTLFPAQRNHNALLTAHQDLTDRVEVSVDALFNKRWSDSFFAYNAQQDRAVSRWEQLTVAQSFAVAPELRVSIGDSWQLALVGSYSEDEVDYRSTIYNGSTIWIDSSGCYCNAAQSIELSGDGTLFDLPAGAVKAAIGGGYRNNDYTDLRVGSAVNFAQSQDSYFAFGEINLPLVAPHQKLGGVSALNLNASARYENYGRTGDIVTPKLGLIYEPVAGLAVKASWGKSFRAPTLRQRYLPASASLSRPSYFGGVDAGQDTVLYFQGGNPDLKPERATSLSVGIQVKPAALPGLDVELSYYATRYIDRIVTPIGIYGVVLRDPAYAAQITANPSPALQAEVIENAIVFSNGGIPYDPANVIALIDNSNVNAGRQDIEGVDALVRYDADLPGADQRLSLTGNVTYLESSQRLSPGQPTRQLAGLIFNPPHWRGRGTATWHKGNLSLTTVLSYIGGIEDTRPVPTAEVEGMTTIDATLRYFTGEGSDWWKGWDITLSAQNLLNAKPDVILTTFFLDTPYDSTNYSGLGRVVGLSLARRW